MGPKQKLIRETLRSNPEGMTVLQLAELAGTGTSHVHRMLHKFPDAYIDRWIKTGNFVAAVWCVVVPPPHCPRPDRKKKK
jgi:predicted transcriptional regulator